MDFIRLPVTDDPWQVMYLSVSPDGNAFSAKVELRWLSAPERWFLSISDAATGQEYVRQVPLVCSLEYLNDLLLPFQYLFLGSGLGSFFCLKAVEHPASVDPGRDNLAEFGLYWGDHTELEDLLSE